MSIGTSQSYLDWALLQDDRDEDNQRECEEMLHEMTKQERADYEQWLDTLEQGERDEQG